MSKFKEPFTLFSRKSKSGKIIYYYQVYLSDGKRSTAKSTGKTSKAEARAYCYALEKSGALIPEQKCKGLLFKNYFQDWWEWGPNSTEPTICPYLTRKFLRGQKPSYAHAKIVRNRFMNHILPYFGDMYIGEITTKYIEIWLDNLARTRLCGKSQCDLLSLLRIMFKEARRMGDIETNPMNDVIPPLKSKPRKYGILSVSETKALFSMQSIDSVWNGELRAMGAYMLARDTAMRPGEVRAIQLKHMHFLSDGKCIVDIVQAVDHASHRIKETKTGAVLTGVPVRSDTAKILSKVCDELDDPEALVFSKDGAQHVSENYLKRRLYRALRGIGISEEERKSRNITQYSFRSLAITRLRQQGISDIAVRSLARHKTPIMTDGYTVFDDEESLKQIHDIYGEA